MALIENWRGVVRHAWSIRLILLAGVLDGLCAGLAINPYLLPVPVAAVAWASVAVNASAFVARLAAQKELSRGDAN